MKKMDKNEVFLAKYPIQKDLRIRMPKQILNNLSINVGTYFDIYINPVNNDIILRVNKVDSKNMEVDKNA